MMINIKKPIKINNFSEIDEKYDSIICDIWGVIHNGDELFSSSVECLLRYKKLGYPIILVTNAPRPSSEIKVILEKMGLNEKCYDKIITSGDLTQKILNKGDLGSSCYHIGPDRDLKVFEGVNVKRVDFENADFIFVTGLYDDENENEESYLPLLELAKKRNLKLLCANPDIWVQRGNELVPCAGAISKKYKSIGGDTINIGKPFSPIFDEALKQIEFISENNKNSTIVIGDGIDTDIKGANNYKLDSLLTLGGLFSGQKNEDIMKSINKKNVFPTYYINELV
ncbi:TIGR01459 family HAD-type hydrolase [bacterium]|nr:TIGR01459 family HAD-type hydrolase [bacterium]